MPLASASRSQYKPINISLARIQLGPLGLSRLSRDSLVQVKIPELSNIPWRFVTRTFSNLNKAFLEFSGLLAEVLKSETHDWQAAASSSELICLTFSGLSHFVATRTVGKDELTSAAANG